MPTTPLSGRVEPGSTRTSQYNSDGEGNNVIKKGPYMRYPSAGFPFETAQDASHPAEGSHSRSGSNGAIPARKSVQFDRPSQATTLMTPAVGGVEDVSVDDSGAAGRSRERLRARMRSFGLPKKPRHRRTRSAQAPGDRGYDDEATTGQEKGVHDDADTEQSAGEPSAPTTPALGKRKQIHPPAGTYSQTEPNTPVNARYNSSSSTPEERSSDRARPPMPMRRATMNDIPEQSTKSLSDDEGHHRIRDSPAWRRGSAWLQQAQNQSFIAARRRSAQGESSDKGGTSTPKRSLRALRSKTASGVDSSPAGRRSRKDPSQVWKRMKAQMKLKTLRKKEKGTDYVKSAELMAELMAASPAALILASAFQRDEHDKKKVPVLLEQLKIRVIDSEFVEDTERHVKFRIELEYGNGLMRMHWTIWRYLTDFLNLHLKFTGSAINMRRKDRQAPKRKLPKFPKSAFPVLRGARGAALTDEDDEEEVPPAESGAAVLSPSSRPTPGHSRRISYHTRSSSTGGSLGLTPEQSGGDVTGLGKRDAFAEKQRRKLEAYIRDMARYFIFRAGSNRMCKFLEISALGIHLAAEGGYHGKEGVLLEKKGAGLGKTVTSRWFLVRQSYIVCVESPSDTVLADVFLVDPDFECEAKRPRIRDQKNAKDMARTARTSATHPKHHRLRLVNSERRITLVARNERQQEQFAESIAFMKDNTKWSQRHRFDSFAPLRTNVFAEWLVDARDYMWKVSRAISMAQDVIYIHDWWLSPELYLRRPPSISHKWRLDRLLQRKAQEGVRIYVIMYRNINSAIPIDSEYSKSSLLDLHPNVYVQRSPNQYRQNVFFWAHHEKICIVDHIVAFCGGVDLCFGRWDTPQHRVMDDKFTGLELGDSPRDVDHCQLWPGKDYSNPRVQDFFKLDDPYGEMYNRHKVPRMPWHDIGMQIVGQPARDLTRHFVQRWNFLLRQRTPHRPTPVLLPPPDFEPEELKELGFDGTCDIQMLRSCSEWSIGTPGKTEHSIQNAYIKLIEESDHFVYIENQFFISSCTVEGTQMHNKIGDALVDRIIKAYERDEEWMAIIVIPLMPGFQNLVHETDGTSVRLIMQCQFRSICRGDSSIWGRLLARGIEPTDYIQFYSLRSWGKIGPDNALTSEQLYIHAKCMIVDDRHVIIGSANLNERSMLGSRDSEVAAVVRDKDMIDSVMSNAPYKVGRFPHTLRMRLMREHLGLDVDAIRDAEVDEYQRQSKDEADLANHASSPSSHRGPRTDSGSYTDPDTESSVQRAHSPQDMRKGDTARCQTPEDFTRAPKSSKDSVKTYPNEKATTSEHSRQRSSSKRRIDQMAAPADVLSHEEEPALPPAELGRMSTRDLGLSQLSQLPSLPETDDTDIGGPPIRTSPLSPLVSEIHPPVVGQDCMKDPLSEGFRDRIWHVVAENNTKLFRQVFRCMPDDLVKDWATYWESFEYSERFNESQGLAQPKGRAQTGTPSKTGPPGTGAERVNPAKSISKTADERLFDEKMFNEDKAKEAAIGGAINSNSASTLGNDLDIKRLAPGVSSASTAGTVEHADDLNEKLTNNNNNDSSKSRVGFDVPSSKETGQVGTSLDEKRAANGGVGINRATGGSTTTRRRRNTTKSSAGPRATDPILSTAQAEELLKLVQGHLVVFPYHWLAKEEEGSKWLYGVDQMAPLEIYD